MRFLCPIFFCLFLFLTAPLFAYTTHRTTVGPLTVYFGTEERIAKEQTITELNRELPLSVHLVNNGNTSITVKYTFSTIEPLEFQHNQKTVSDTMILERKGLPFNGREHLFQVTARHGTYNAHYPVRFDFEFELDGKTHKGHVIQVIKTDFTGSPKVPFGGQTVANAKALRLNTVPNKGGLALANLNTYRGQWNYDNQPVQDLSVGFQGSDPTSAASISRVSMTRGGVNRQSISMHPPYRGGVGNVSTEFRVQLPPTKPISLSYFTAMRDANPPEAPSDGVTFRIKVDGNTFYEEHNAETHWIEHNIDLSGFAGKEILLTLESDPGPKRNTNCDSCFWGDVVLFAGEKPKVLTAEEKQQLFAENLQAIKTGKADSQKTQVFKLDGGLTAAVTFGTNGFIDGVIGLGNAEKQVQFDGLRVWVKGQAVGSAASAIGFGEWTRIEDEPGTWHQMMDIEGIPGVLRFGMQKKGPAVQFRIDSSSLISRIEFGPATHHAKRVYYGHGYCIEEPEAFTANANGHDLSTSHVGMDFDNGLSVLQATSFPPDQFIVDPKSKRYTISVHPDSTLTLLPGLKGALDCAVRFRPIHEAKPSPGFTTKAGRFVFDIWGGKFTEHTEVVKHAAKYGLTDAQFIVHNWQRYGYDVRLPDIFPPNPDRGTLAEMQETLKLCDSLGIQYGVHDNYIDFYPDADEFSFDVTTFTPEGQPKPAWNNHGVKAQSYQFRPDHVQRFLDRNLDLIVPELPMSTYFVDVLVSLPPIDFYDRDGKFYSRQETLLHWAKAFASIRERLSEANKNFESATTSSESGLDSLVGYLDGADCQFMFLSPEPGEFRYNVRCKSWSRVPWFDAVHHTKFSLHGAGYSNRYEAQRGRELHGIESDDYIASEILTGHALMVDWQSAKRGAVRKYWLAQDLIRHLADQNILSTEFVDDNIFRLKITWSSGITIYVNTGEEDWTIEPGVKLLSQNITLPQYGYWAEKPRRITLRSEPDNFYSSSLVSGIFKQGDKIVEMSRYHRPASGVVVPQPFYVYYNARQQDGVDYPGMKTKGGFKIETYHGKDVAVLIPLPDEPATEITLSEISVPQRIAAIDETGKELREVPFEKGADAATFTTQAGEFAYRIVW